MTQHGAQASGSASGVARGGGLRGNITAVLTETAASEVSLAKAYASARRLYIWGVLPRALYDDYERRRLEVFGVQRSLYDLINNALTRLGQPNVIPRPSEYPALPPWSAMPRGATRGTPTAVEQPVGTAGLGAVAVPAIIWAAAVLATIAQVVIVVAVVWVVGDLLARVFGMRENTRRNELALDDARARFDRCIEETHDVARCAGLFPAPEMHYEDTRPPEAPWNADALTWGAGIAAVVLSLGVVGYLFYEYATPGRLAAWRAGSSTSTTPKGISSARGNPRRLSSGDVSRGLRGG